MVRVGARGGEAALLEVISGWEGETMHESWTTTFEMQEALHAHNGAQLVIASSI